MAHLTPASSVWRVQRKEKLPLTWEQSRRLDSLPLQPSLLSTTEPLPPPKKELETALDPTKACEWREREENSKIKIITFPAIGQHVIQWLAIITCRGKSKTPADHLSIPAVPQGVAHCPPGFVHAHFHSALASSATSSQSQVSRCTPH